MPESVPFGRARGVIMASKKTKTSKKKTSKKKPSPPKVLHCSRCKFVTRSGIAGMSKHYRQKHPKCMKAR